jgi:serine protease Do
MDQQPERDMNRGPETPKPQPSHTKLRLLSAAFLVLISLSAGFLGGHIGARNGADDDSSQKQQVVLKSQGQLISDIAERVGESVVSIETTSQTTSPGFFGQPRASEEESAGTGVVLNKDGLIMTNRHVVPSGTTTVNVVLSDGTRFEDVEVIGRTTTNDTLDIAFLKIGDTNGKELVPAILGDSGKTDVGDTVIAIGNALGQFQNTVTSGIISGYGRSVTASDGNGSESESLENLIQTDTAINPGNSGGPLVNLDGEVIGINTAVAGDAQNIGFAIPVNDVKGLVATVSDTGKLERPYLGVVYVPLTSDIAKQYSLTTEQGAYIPLSSQVGQDSVVDGDPAAKAGITEGDIITKVSGEAVDDKHSLTSRLGKHRPGEKVDLTIIRDGKERTIEVTLGTAPQS